MTNERKIEILEKCKVFLKKHYKEYGICTAFFLCCAKSENTRAGNFKSIDFYLQGVLMKYKPKQKDECLPWWELNEYGLKKRIRVINSIIKELKTLKQ